VRRLPGKLRQPDEGADSYAMSGAKPTEPVCRWRYKWSSSAWPARHRRYKLMNSLRI